MGGTKLALRALKEIGLGTVNGVIDKWRQWALVSVLVAENLALLAAWGIARWRQQGLSPVERGKQIAERLGCFACHGPGGIRGITFAKKPRFDCPP
jgi:cytochrome c553